MATYLANTEYSKHRILSGWPDIVWVTDDMEDYATEYAKLENLIENYVTQFYTEFIIGRLDINDDEQWKKYINGLNALDLNRYIELIELYVSRK